MADFKRCAQKKASFRGNKYFMSIFTHQKNIYIVKKKMKISKIVRKDIFSKIFILVLGIGLYALRRK